jgi:hypothetical protein
LTPPSQPHGGTKWWFGKPSPGRLSVGASFMLACLFGFESFPPLPGAIDLRQIRSKLVAIGSNIPANSQQFS